MCEEEEEGGRDRWRGQKGNNAASSCSVRVSPGHGCGTEVSNGTACMSVPKVYTMYVYIQCM